MLQIGIGAKGDILSSKLIEKEIEEGRTCDYFWFLEDSEYLRMMILWYIEFIVNNKGVNMNLSAWNEAGRHSAGDRLKGLEAKFLGRYTKLN